MAAEPPVSKTQRKKAVHELQDLGVELVALSDERLAAIEMPERLRDAVLEARRITAHEGRRRQLQYIGKLMRKVDAEPIRAAIEAWQGQSHSRVAAQKRVERWRERLLAEPDALAELLAQHRGADGQRLRALVRGALREREKNQPPRNYRELFQALRVILAPL